MPAEQSNETESKLVGYLSGTNTTFLLPIEAASVLPGRFTFNVINGGGARRVTETSEITDKGFSATPQQLGSEIAAIVGEAEGVKWLKNLVFEGLLIQCDSKRISTRGRVARGVGGAIAKVLGYKNVEIIALSRT